MVSLAIIHNHPIHYQHLLFSELTNQGLDYEVVFTAATSGARMDAPLAENGEYRYRIGWHGTYESAPTIHVARSVWQSLSELRPRVVVVSGWNDAACWAAWGWAQLHKVPVILWAESNEFDRPRRAWKELPKRLLVSRCALAHVYGTSNIQYLQRLGMSAGRIYAKRAVVDTERFLLDQAVPSRADHKTLLYVGRFSPEKNLPAMLRALGNLRQEAARPRLILDLVGYGPCETDLRALVEQLGIAPFVRFRGKFPQADLPGIYGAADALVLPSVSETWGLVVNEAMLSGLPVAVSNRCGCAADLVRPETGWTFSPFDEGEITRMLERVSQTPRPVLVAMGQAGRRIAAEYSARNCAATVVHMVRSLAEPRETSSSMRVWGAPV